MKLLLATGGGAANIRKALERECHVVVVEHDLERVVAAAKRCNVVLIDTRLGGIPLYHRLRDAGVSAPILALVDPDTPDKIIDLLDAGADDVVPRSVDTRELLARVRALQRRAGLLVSKCLRLDFSRHAAVRDDELIPLSIKEFRLLEYLLQHEGQVVPRWQLRETIWPEDRDYASNIVDVYIYYLRRKLERGEHLIRTVRPLGYKLELPSVSARNRVRKPPPAGF